MPRESAGGGDVADERSGLVLRRGQRRRLGRRVDLANGACSSCQQLHLLMDLLGPSVLA